MSTTEHAALTDGAPIRVVVADDADDLRRVVRAAVERHPHFVVVGEAADGDEAVRVAAETDPDIVLLDLDMPRVSGLEALPRLREVAPAAKVVVLSGLSRQPMEGLARSAGAVGFLEKGIPSRRLVDELIAVAGVLEAVQGALAVRRLSLDGETLAPRTARRFVDETLRRWDCADVLETVTLLVSELVTNAVVHARSDAEVSVVLHHDVIRVEVTDTSVEPPQRRDPQPHEPNGRGLAMVDKLTTAWGVEVTGAGKVVWFEVPRLDAHDVVIR